MEIYEAIQRARMSANLGVNEAATKLDTYGPTLSRMEKGEAGIKADMLVKMSALYRVSIDRLVSGEVVKTPSSLDIEMMGLVVTTIAEHVQNRSLQPTPKKLSKAVIQVYLAEANYLMDHPDQELDLNRHADLVDAIFEE